MVEYVKTPKEVTLDESDVITLAEASRLSGRSLQALGMMLDRGSLPWYEYPAGVPGRSGARFTSRKAAQGLGKKRKTSLNKK
jgi:hypothetical protein